MYIVLIPGSSPSFSSISLGISEMNSLGEFICLDPKIVRKLANDKNTFSRARVSAT